MSTPADCWVPVPLRWRHVQPGDVIVGVGGALWAVTGAGPDGARHRLDVVRSYHGGATHYGDPDDTVTVLVPATERDSLTYTRDQLGARIIERRAAA